MSHSILHVGITSSEIAMAVGAENAAKWIDIVEKGIAKDKAAFEAAGMRYEFMGYTSTEGMGRLEKKLKEGDYDGVGVGWGIRGTKEMTAFFEELINTIHTQAPNAKFLFNTAPDGTFEAATRQFSDVKTA